MAKAIVPIITPFDKNNKIDLNKLKEHANFLIKKKIDYIMLAGSTGLGPSLSLKEKMSMVDSLEYIKDKIIMQVSSLNFDEVVQLAEYCKNKGIYSIASLPPYYYPRLLDEWYIDFYVRISKIYRTIIYNFPLTTNYNIQPYIVKSIIKNGGEIVGIKDTLPDINHMLMLKYEFENNLQIYSGPDSLLMPAIRCGLDGGVVGSGNYLPDYIVSIINNPSSRESYNKQKILTKVTQIVQKYGQWAANYKMVKIINKYEVGIPRYPIPELTTVQTHNLEKEVNSILG